MELNAFLTALSELSFDDIRALALDIDAMTATPAEEVEITRAYLRIEASLRSQRRLRQAALAGHRATEAVQRVARREGIELPDTGVTRVARWADTIARAIVAADDTEDELVLFTHGADHVDALAELTAV